MSREIASADDRDTTAASATSTAAAAVPQRHDGTTAGDQQSDIQVHDKPAAASVGVEAPQDVTAPTTPIPGTPDSPSADEAPSIGTPAKPAPEPDLPASLPHSGARADDREPSTREPVVTPFERSQPFRWRDRTLHLGPSERTALRTVGTFRTVTVDDLATLAYGGNRTRLEADLRQLRRQGLVLDGRVPMTSRPHRTRGSRRVTTEPVVALSRDGHAVASAFREIPAQTLHWGLVKPKERAHDTAIYRLYHAEAARITQAGGSIRRVVLDAELKGRLAATRNRPRHTVPPNRPSDAASPDRTAAAAAAHGLRVVEGRIPIPDLRIEYDTADGDRCHVDLELATAHYKPGQIAAKAQAGFVLYAPASQTGRLTAVLQERGLIAEILAL